ncbi:hypothetical protein [Agriterribacter sp.]|uniref:hypothetical protein n=1 Tax=Agriterribacter sp. TaxID=2821509 RepID=UPI002CECE49D|nr:hypothetical protein [Agriterribacter sp.]HTN05161.1 hypothetical protein [Agriterribacter sp.]
MKVFFEHAVIMPSALYYSLKVKTLLIIVIVLLSPILYASGNNHNYPLSSAEQYLNWQHNKTVGGVELYYAISLCKGGSAVFLKMNNKNRYPVEVSWKEVFETQAEKAAEGYGGVKKIIVQPGEIFESDCDNPTHKVLVVPAGNAIPTYIAVISNFNYKDVTVNKAN